MISTSVISLLRPPSQAYACLQLWRPSLSVVGASIQLRYASHKSSKALKALKSSKMTETRPRKPIVTKPSEPKAPRNPPAPPLTTKPIFPKSPPIREQLERADGPVLLYHKDHWKVAIACYVTAGLGIWVMFNNYYVNIKNPTGIPQWVKTVHFISIAFIGFGVATVFAYPVRLIRSIRAIPYHPMPRSPPKVKLEICSNNVLSFFLPALKTEATLEEVYLGRAMKSKEQVESVTPEGKLARVQHTLATGPYKMFSAVKRGISRENIVPVHIKSSYLNLGIHEDGWQWQTKGLNQLIGSNKKW